MSSLLDHTEAGLALARAQMLDRGEVSVGIVNELTRRSWRRSMAAGLAPLAPARLNGLSPSALRALVEREQQFIGHARPVMAYVFGHVAGAGNIVILACGNGIVVNALGDPVFLDKAARVALQPGHSWHEAERGTNAIGTALAENAPITVHGREHFLERNGFLTCTAAPVHDPLGQVLGVIDVSGDWTTRSQHTETLVRIAAHMIEAQIFNARHRGCFRLDCHAHAEGLGSLAQISLALDEAGRVVGANHAARAAWPRLDLGAGAVALERVLGISAAALMKQAAAGGDPFSLALPGGRVVYAAWQRPAAPPARRPAPRTAADALAALDTGDPVFHDLLTRARRLAGKSLPLLLLGESGTGKDVLARAIHLSGPRRRGAFVAVNCAALPENLIEAELFGYRAGAFTGAAREGNPGRLREANGGTLFLDEIGDMALGLQTRLLRVLENREVVPLGGGQPVRLDFALISATHRDLAVEVAAGRFRTDLYYRLAGMRLALPPLRARKDFAAVLETLLARLAPGRAITLAPDLLAPFSAYAWPGNIRELLHVLAGAVALLEPDEGEIDLPHLCPDFVARLHAPVATEVAERGAAETERYASTAIAVPPTTLRRLSQTAVRAALDQAAGNVSEAARRLAISRKTIYRKLREFGLDS
jgi:transcriptional regulator of acetoin/glycerol metabolism